MTANDMIRRLEAEAAELEDTVRRMQGLQFVGSELPWHSHKQNAQDKRTLAKMIRVHGLPREC